MKVSNPLTIIAIFAGTAEAFATGALIALPLEMQSLFIYFVMLFPLIIVITFFAILVLKPHVLYAPSDFSDERNFLAVNKIRENVKIKVAEVIEEVGKESPELNPEILEGLKNKITNSVINITQLSIESEVHDFLRNQPNFEFTATGISHALCLHFSDVTDALIKLESKGNVIKRKEKKSEIIVWQIKT